MIDENQEVVNNLEKGSNIIEYLFTYLEEINNDYVIEDDLRAVFCLMFAIKLAIACQKTKKYLNRIVGIFYKIRNFETEDFCTL